MFRYSTIKDYHNALKNGQTTCVEAVRFFIQSIEAQQGLNAWIELFTQEALDRAAELDASLSQYDTVPKMFGVVIGLKDLISFKGHKVSAASQILSNYTAIYSATVVTKLLAEGAIILGRQNCDEFAMGSSNEHSAFGLVRNAIDQEKVPGGSSGGSAVAVQAGMCMVSIGTDTGGSVRQPADFCGIVGLKPTYGRVSRYGVIAYASSFDQIGIFANSVADAALVLEVIAGPDEYDSTVSLRDVPNYSQELLSPKQPIRLAYFRESLKNSGLDPQIRAGFQDFIKTLSNSGYIVEPIDFELLKYVVPTYYVLTTAEASSNLTRYDGVRFGHRSQEPNLTQQDALTQLYKASRSEGFGKEVKRRIMLGTFVLSSGYYDAYFTKAQQVRKILSLKTQEIFAHYDAIISPTVPSTAFPIGTHSQDPVEMYLADIYTVYANLVGIPGISLPLFKHPNGMPYGLQLMTSHFDEVSLLRLSNQLTLLANAK